MYSCGKNRWNIIFGLFADSPVVILAWKFLGCLVILCLLVDTFLDLYSFLKLGVFKVLPTIAPEAACDLQPFRKMGNLSVLIHLPWWMHLKLSKLSLMSPRKVCDDRDWKEESGWVSRVTKWTSRETEWTSTIQLSAISGSYPFSNLTFFRSKGLAFSLGWSPECIQNLKQSCDMMFLHQRTVGIG